MRKWNAAPGRNAPALCRMMVGYTDTMVLCCASMATASVMCARSNRIAAQAPQGECLRRLAALIADTLGRCTWALAVFQKTLEQADGIELAFVPEDTDAIVERHQTDWSARDFDKRAQSLLSSYTRRRARCLALAGKP